LKIITFASLKGGVGKTSCAVFVSQALAQHGRKVLTIDMDGPNNNLTDYFLRKQTVDELEKRNLGHVIVGALSPQEAIFRTDSQVDVIAATQKMSRYLAVEMGRDPGLLLRFPGIIKRLVEYDFVIMDTPPAYVPEFLCGIYASQQVIVPAALHRWMISGFNLVKEEVNKSETTTGIPIKLSIIPSCVTEKEAADVVQTTQWSSFKTAILRSASIRNAGNRGIPLKEQTKPWQQYQLFAEELEANQ